MNWARAQYQALYLAVYGATPWSSESGFLIPRSHTQIGLVQSQHFHHQEDLLEIWHLWGLWILEKSERPNISSPYYVSASQVALVLKNLSANVRDTRDEPGGLESIGSQRVGHDWGDLAHTHYHVSSTAFGSSQVSPLIFIVPPLERWCRNSGRPIRLTRSFPGHNLLKSVGQSPMCSCSSVPRSYQPLQIYFCQPKETQHR